MLVLSRFRNESIVVGDDIVITVVDIRGDKVRIGIEAPQIVAVHRQEVYDAIKREGGSMSQTQEVTPPQQLVDFGRYLRDVVDVARAHSAANLPTALLREFNAAMKLAYPQPDETRTAD